jgi:hypothetical protein
MNALSNAIHYILELRPAVAAPVFALRVIRNQEIVAPVHDGNESKDQRDDVLAPRVPLVEDHPPWPSPSVD